MNAVQTDRILIKDLLVRSIIGLSAEEPPNWQGIVVNARRGTLQDDRATRNEFLRLARGA